MAPSFYKLGATLLSLAITFDQNAVTYSPMKLDIRLADHEDINILSALGITTCYEAYFAIDPSRDLADYCARIYSPEKVQTEFTDENSTYLIAECDARAGGFAKLRENNKVECLGEANAIELQRIYVLAQLKGHGLGRALLSKCVEIGRDRGFQQLFLGVWDKNVAAQEFYERIGMKRVGTTGFNDGKNDFLNFVYAVNI